MGRRRADQSSLKREGEVLHVELLKGKVVWVVCVPLRALRIYNVAVGSSSLFSKCLLYSVVRFVMGVSSRPFSDSYDSVPFLLSY